MKTLLVLALALLASCNDRKAQVEVARAAPAQAAAPAAPPLATSCATICNKTVACAGLTGEAAKPRRDECVQVCTSQGQGNPLAAEIIPAAMAEVAAKCGGTGPCDKFGDCYMDTLKQVQARLVGPSSTAPHAPLAPETKARFVGLVCAIVAENPGHIPNLEDPNPSPKMRELKAMMTQLVEERGTVSDIADLMKEAIATCGAK